MGIALTETIFKKPNSLPSHHAIVDFEGTASQLEGNLNAPVAVTKAAVLYVFRLLIDKDIPLNSGCLDQIDIRIPEGCLLNPSDDAAVVGGNAFTLSSPKPASLSICPLSPPSFSMPG